MDVLGRGLLRGPRKVFKMWVGIMSKLEGPKVCPIMSKVITQEGRKEPFLWEIYCKGEQCEVWIAFYTEGAKDQCGLKT